MIINLGRLKPNLRWPDLYVVLGFSDYPSSLLFNPLRPKMPATSTILPSTSGWVTGISNDNAPAAMASTLKAMMKPARRI